MLANGSAQSTVVVTGYADDEIDEIWKELCDELVWLTMIALMITGAMIWTARLALHPLEAVADGMDRLSRGEFTVLDDAQAYELRRIKERFDESLGASLQRASADNKNLIRSHERRSRNPSGKTLREDCMMKSVQRFFR